MIKATKEKHVPQRMCFVTREKKPKNELLRLIKTEDGNVMIDLIGKYRGRGANISKDIKVFDRAVKKNLIEKALKMNRKLSTEDVKILRKGFELAIEETEFRKSNKPVKIRIKSEDLEKIRQS